MKTPTDTDKTTPEKPKSRPRTAKARENHMINLAMDLAEKKLNDGTASSQIISYFLDLASPEQKLKTKMLEEQVKLVHAKTEAIESSKDMQELYRDAIKAMSEYCIPTDDGEDSDEELY